MRRNKRESVIQSSVWKATRAPARSSTPPVPIERFRASSLPPGESIRITEQGAPAAAIVGIQALSFGVAHIQGFPRGALGVALAAVYGLLLGVLRLRAGGLLAPVLAHIGADAVIYALILATALGLLG